MLSGCCCHTLGKNYLEEECVWVGEVTQCVLLKQGVFEMSVELSMRNLG